MQVIKTNPTSLWLSQISDVLLKENLNYMCGLIRPKYLHLFNIRNIPQSWSISPNTQYVEQLQPPTVNHDIIPTWTSVQKFHNIIQSVLI